MLRTSRWSVLAAYSLLTACTQLLWLSYASITTEVGRAMDVSDGAVGDLAVVFPVVYVVLALPAGRWLDGHFASALSVGAGLTAAGAVLRLVDPMSFGWTLAGQCVIATGQPFVLNAITKLAARSFPPRQRTAAISVGSVSMFVGVLAAVVFGRPLLDAGGLRLLDWSQAALTLVAAASMVATASVPPAYREDPSVALRLGWIRHDRFLWLLGGLLFVGMGEFNAVATWLESILDHFGSGAAAGYLIAIMTGGGVLGAAVLPTPVAVRQWRRQLLLLVLGATAVTFVAIALVHAVGFVACLLFAEGFVLLAALPVVLDWSELHAGEERAASAVGFLLLCGNLGGIVLTLGVQATIGNGYTALITLAAVACCGVPVALRLPQK